MASALFLNRPRFLNFLFTCMQANHFLFVLHQLTPVSARLVVRCLPQISGVGFSGRCPQVRHSVISTILIDMVYLTIRPFAKMP